MVFLFCLALLWLLLSSRRANRRTASAAERAAEVIAPRPPTRPLWAPLLLVPAYMTLVAGVLYLLKLT